jgi:hypothetical protein
MPKGSAKSMTKSGSKEKAIPKAKKTKAIGKKEIEK